MPTKDTDLIVRAASDGDLTSTEVDGGFDIKKTPIKGLALHVVVKAVDATTDTLIIKVFEATASTAPATNDLIASHPPISDIGEYVVPFVTDKRYVYVEEIVAGGTPNFGAVEIAIVENVGSEWTRLTSFV